jgi:broad specificity phosphatase PhoE
MTVKIILVRHGETAWNRVERFRGQFDIPLNSTGIEQAERTAQRIVKSWKPAAVHTSPLSRAYQTAERIATVCGLPVQPAHGLTDIDYGDWQGLTPKAVQEKWPALAEKWFQQPGTLIIPGGETLSDVQTRALAALQTFSEGYKDQEIVLVSHTVVIRAILLGILRADLDRLWQIGQEPCAINLIEYNPENAILLSINCVDHLLD